MLWHAPEGAQICSGGQEPHEPPQPSSPHDFPTQAGVQPPHRPGSQDLHSETHAASHVVSQQKASCWHTHPSQGHPPQVLPSIGAHPGGGHAPQSFTQLLHDSPAPQIPLPQTGSLPHVPSGRHHRPPEHPPHEPPQPSAPHALPAHALAQAAQPPTWLHSITHVASHAVSQQYASMSQTAVSHAHPPQPFCFGRATQPGLQGPQSLSQLSQFSEG